ncbi:MAG: hypothetical protein U1C46_06570, partial [Bacteroidales bacterium]|nr:hypothetical protein [Bacteroidales bacterium]
EDWHQPAGTYIPEYEAIEMMAKEMVEDLFDNWKDELIEHLLSQQINNFFAGIIGMYQACSTADINDDYDALGDDPNEYLTDTFAKTMNEICGRIAPVYFNINALTNSLNNLFRYISEQETITNKLTISFDELLKQIVRDQSMASVVAGAMQQLSTSKSLFPRLSVSVQKYFDLNSWIKLSEELYSSDVSVAQDLMDYYHKSGLYSEFHRVAQDCFGKNQSAYTDFIVERLDDAFEPVFTKTVLLHKAGINHNLETYRRAAPWMSPEEKEAFIHKLRHYDLFYGLLMAEEKQFEQLYDFLRNKKTISLSDFQQLVVILLQIMPFEAFTLVETKVNHTLAGQKGRDTYAAIARLLKAVYDSGKINETRNLVLSLYKHKPTLPALRDELRKAGLI